MPIKADRILELFFLFPQEEIDRAIAQADASTLSEMPPREVFPRSPERAAAQYHEQLIRAHAAQLQPNLSEDLRLLLAHQPAEQLADHAVEAAGQTKGGVLATIWAQMRAIEIREGLENDEFWLIGEGPEDHRALAEQATREEDRVQDAIILQVLRRYRFDRFADLFASDRMTYEVMCEVGRRQSAPPTAKENALIDVDQTIDDQLLEKYGRRAYDLLQARLRAVGL